MGEPRDKECPELQDVVHEIISAMSSLNMGKEGIARSPGEPEWISNSLLWGKHSYEHLRTALNMIVDIIEREQNALGTR